MKHVKLLMCTVLLSGQLAAQGPVSDDGILIVRRAGVVVAQEDFEVRREGAGWTLTTTSRWDTTQTVILAVFTPRRVTVRVAGSGGERAREMPTGGTLVVDDSAFAFLAVALDHPTGPTRVTNPRTGARIDGTVRNLGATPEGTRRIEIAIEGAILTVVFDRDGRFLRAQIPARELDITRQ